VWWRNADENNEYERHKRKDQELFESVFCLFKKNYSAITPCAYPKEQIIHIESEIGFLIFY